MRKTSECELNIQHNYLDKELDKLIAYFEERNKNNERKKKPKKS
jgi:hypothetical protein